MTDHLGPEPDPFAGADAGTQELALIVRHLAGEATVAEAETLRAWVAGHPRRERMLAAMRDAWAVAGRADELARGVDADRLAAGVSGRIRRQERAAFGVWPHGGTGSAGRLAPRRRVAVAAGTAAALLVGAIAITWIAQRAITFQMRGGVEYATARGERATVTLGDGTQITLAPESRLRVARRYDVGARDVYLDGQAAFDVVHVAERPFAVHARGAVARDVGTAFVVRAYANERSVAVAVREGLVALRAGAAGAGRDSVLSASAVAVVDSGGAVHVRRGVDVAPYVGWVQGRLTLRDAPVSEVLAELSRWYQIDITASDPVLLARQVSIDFAGTPTDEMLRALAAALDVNVERSGATARLVSRRAP